MEARFLGASELYLRLVVAAPLDDASQMPLFVYSNVSFDSPIFSVPTDIFSVILLLSNFLDKLPMVSTIEAKIVLT